jgi:hypothetical protein
MKSFYLLINEIMKFEAEGFGLPCTAWAGSLVLEWESSAFGSFQCLCSFLIMPSASTLCVPNAPILKLFICFL